MIFFQYFLEYAENFVIYYYFATFACSRKRRRRIKILLRLLVFGEAVVPGVLKASGVPRCPTPFFADGCQPGASVERFVNDSPHLLGRFVIAWHSTFNFLLT